MSRQQPKSRIETMPCTARRAVALLAATVSVVGAAHAAPVAGAVGWEYSQGAGDQITRGVLAAGVAKLGGVEATLAGTRFDDSIVGMGTGVTAGLGMPVAPLASAQVQANRYIGDADFRAWRVKAGPQLDLPGGSHVLVAWSRYQDDADAHADGAVLESSMPVGHALTARLNGAIAKNPDGRQASEAATGLSWTAAPHLQLLGDVGFARNGGTSLSQPVPRSVLGELLGLGPGQAPASSASRDEVSATARVGMRLLFP